MARVLEVASRIHVGANQEEGKVAAQLLDSSSQYAYIGDKEYAANGEIVVASKKAQVFFIENINPGNSVEGIVAWDVPEGQEPDRLELHDSPFSGGVTVDL